MLVHTHSYARIPSSAMQSLRGEVDEALRRPAHATQGSSEHLPFIVGVRQRMNFMRRATPARSMMMQQHEPTGSIQHHQYPQYTSTHEFNSTFSVKSSLHHLFYFIRHSSPLHNNSDVQLTMKLSISKLTYTTMGNTWG